MKITPPVDNVNIQGLKKVNRASGEVKQVDHTEPSPAIEAEENHLPKSALAHPERRKQQRRKQQRRKENKEVLLDTRSHHERRKTLRRHSDQVSDNTDAATNSNEAQTAINKGIDIIT